MSRAIALVLLLLVLVAVGSCSSTQPSGVEVASPVDESADFYPFDEPPILTDFVSPVYPAAVQSEGAEGTVLVKVLVGPDGSVQTSMVLWSSDSRFEEAALQASGLWKFKPAKWREEATRAYVAVPVHFTLSH